jgi:hypothetical protein
MNITRSGLREITNPRIAGEALVFALKSNNEVACLAGHGSF